MTPSCILYDDVSSARDDRNPFCAYPIDYNAIPNDILPYCSQR